MAVSSLSSLMRINGMSSGMDTESMVSSLMQVEKLKVSRVAQQKTLLEWRKESQSDINKLIQSFRENTMSVLSPETNLFTESAFKTFTVTMSQSTAAITVTAGSGAQTGSHTINRIDSLATSAKISGITALFGESGLNTGTALADLASTLGLTFGGENADSLSFEINGTSFSFKSSDSLKTVFQSINSSTAGVSIAYTQLNDRIVLSTKATGSAAAIQIVNGAGNLFGTSSAIGINDASNIQIGSDASLHIDGIGVTRSSNTFDIDGATYVLHSTTASTVDFQVSRDVEPAISRIKGFISIYNQLVGALQGTISEEKYTDYPPLTDDQRTEMSESEVVKWESRAKSGLLRNDRDLTSLLSKMRGMLYETVQGVGKSLSDIGIKTGAYYERGKISLDETKLRKAMSEEPDIVMNLFTKTSADPVKSNELAQSGFLPRLLESFSSYTSRFSMTKADEDISKLGTRISALNSQLAVRENQYWLRFASMEKALTTMQSQSSWLSQQFGS